LLSSLSITASALAMLFSRLSRCCLFRGLCCFFFDTPPPSRAANTNNLESVLSVGPLAGAEDLPRSMDGELALLAARDFEENASLWLEQKSQHQRKGSYSLHRFFNAGVFAMPRRVKLNRRRQIFRNRRRLEYYKSLGRLNLRTLTPKDMVLSWIVARRYRFFHRYIF